MKKIIYHVLLLLVAAMTLASCKKEEENFRIIPQTPIIFDDNINKITADYPLNSNIVLKISAAGASSVTVTNLTGGTKVLGTLPIVDGTATLSVPANSIRATGTVVGAGTSPASSRAANTFNFKVDATLAGGTTATRYYTAVIVRP
ncbi:hypothetical protein SAMN00120144_0346 [Hymenobacter roseosalivarius DSM 11622]|uniref:DUF1735 domain-containing protein n=1 Tax=Hymenobacter roseosalivarius DSM 11622 TaxID=645990 RepID=A0A1W1VVB2_9BACT|nr:hypothetical protein [Hymenobacter roseosalivarius]SMB97299.1 hypothetical protein SAMN00120144_0346 [Hymenobacter roseosalivarius DSM 11622]